MEALRTLWRAYSYTFVGLAVLLIAFMLLSFPIGAFTVYRTELGAKSVGRTVSIVPFFVIGIPLLLPASPSVGAMFGALWSLYLVLFLSAAKGPFVGILQSIKKALSQESGPIKIQNSLFSVASVFSLLVVLIQVIDFLQERAGIPTGSLPEEDPIIKFLFISHAPIVEEVGFRVTIVGLGALIGVAGRRFDWKALLVLWSPSKYLRRTLGEESGRELKRVMIAVILSALFFGFAHVLYGAGWQLGKISTSFVAGLGLGWIYVEYGLPAAVLVHWAFNYFGSAFFYFSKAVGQTSIDPIIELIITSLGILSVLNVVMVFYERVVERRKKSNPHTRGSLISETTL